MTTHVSEAEYRPIIEDMVDDVLDAIGDNDARLNRRIGSSRIHIADFSVMRALYEAGESLEIEPSDSLLSLLEPTEDQVRERILVTAKAVGQITVSSIGTFDKKNKWSDAYPNRATMHLLSGGAKVLVRDFVGDLWAPSYTNRFTNAWLSGLTTSDGAEAIK